MNLVTVLDMAASGFGERIVIGSHLDGILASELHERAGRAAATLQRENVGTLAYLGANHEAFAVAVFGAAWAGIPFLPLNYRLGADQLRALLDGHDGVLVVADSVAAPLLAGCRHPVVDRDEWLATTASGELAPEPIGDPEAIAVLLYTSGTTSAPKAAVLRHRHLTSYLFAAVEFGAADGDDAALVSVPPYHVAGVANLLSNLYAGRRIVYLDAFTPEAWLATAREESVTQAMLVPTMLARVVASLDGAADAGLPALRTLSYGGSRMPPALVARALELFPSTDFVNAYGLTETSSTIAILGPDDHRAAVAGNDPVARRRLGSAGRLLPMVEAEVRGPDGAPLGRGEVGELWVRGDQVSGEYLARESPLDASGWFPTRDVASIDDDGYLFIEGRADDTIIRGGENIAPAEIEDALLEHPDISEVAVVGPADEEWGQRIAAVVVARPGSAVDAEQVRSWARQRLRSSKTPDQVVVWEALPQTDTGKVLRRVILAELESSTGRGAGG